MVTRTTTVAMVVAAIIRADTATVTVVATGKVEAVTAAVIGRVMAVMAVATRVIPARTVAAIIHTVAEGTVVEGMAAVTAINA